ILDLVLPNKEAKDSTKNCADDDGPNPKRPRPHCHPAGQTRSEPDKGCQGSAYQCPHDTTGKGPSRHCTLGANGKDCTARDRECNLANGSRIDLRRGQTALLQSLDCDVALAMIVEDSRHNRFSAITNRFQTCIEFGNLCSLRLQ